VLTEDILAVKVLAIVEFFAVPFFKGARTIIGWIVSWNLVTVLKPPLIEPFTVTVKRLEAVPPEFTAIVKTLF